MKNVYVNDFVIGKARDWDGATSLFFNLCDGLFCSAASFTDGHNNTTTRGIARQEAFLRAMGVAEPAQWAPRDDNTEEGPTWLRFLFPKAGRFNLEAAENAAFAKSQSPAPEIAKAVIAAYFGQ